MSQENRTDLSLRLALCRRQLATAKDPQTRDILQVMIENMEDRLETSPEPPLIAPRASPTSH